MKNFYYLREIGKIDAVNTDGDEIKIDFSSLSLLERLVLSAVLTYLRENKEDSSDTRNLYKNKNKLVKALFARKRG